MMNHIQKKALDCLNKKGPMPIKEISENIGYSPECIYKYIRPSVEEGFLEKVKVPISFDQRGLGKRIHIVFYKWASDNRPIPDFYENNKGTIANSTPYELTLQLFKSMDIARL